MSDPAAGFPLPAGTDESLDSAILRLLMDTIPDRIYFKDLDSRFVRVNRAHAQWLGLSSPDQATGKTDGDFFSAAHASAALAAELEIIRTGQPVIGRVEHITKQGGDDGWGSTTKMAWRDARGRIIGTFGLTRDITLAKQAEEKLIEEHNLLRTIIDHVPSRIFVKDTGGRYLINNVAHLDALGVHLQEEARGRLVSDFYTGERASQALDDDAKVLTGAASILDQEKSNFGAGGQTRWSLTTKVPLRDRRGRIIGLVGISHDITDRKRTEQELQRRSAEMEADLLMARQLQEAFFPRNYPTFPAGVPAEASALRFAHRYVPASTLGGDFFDVIPISDTRCGVLICDVMGHGVRAGLLTALIRGVVEEFGARTDDPAQVLGEINRGLIPIIQQTGQPTFATAFFGVIDLAAGTLLFSNAGHPPPFILHGGDGSFDSLVAANPEPAAGLVQNFAYSQQRREFRPGDVLLAYTDGLYEASDTAGRMFGEAALAPTIAASIGRPCPEVISRLMVAVEGFTGRKEFEDDICIIAVARTGR
jgi:sigma-B regulation protein RsbU (phosphoserine phosphatase)